MSLMKLLTPGDSFSIPNAVFGGCQFLDTSGRKCPVLKLKARGFCETHYKAMARSGAFKPSPVVSSDSEPVSPGVPIPSTPANVAHTQRLMARALRKLQRLSPDFVDILLVAAKNAAAKGDAGPSTWALIHSRAVSPIATGTATKGGEGGVTINVGVKVSGTETSQRAEVKTT